MADIRDDPEFQGLDNHSKIDLLIDLGYSEQEVDNMLSGSPLSKNTEQLRKEHKSNLAAGRLADIQGTLGTFAPALVRSGSQMIGRTPMVGALAGGGGEILAQGMEKAAGTREEFNPYAVAGQAALGAYPAGKMSEGLFNRGMEKLSMAAHPVEGAVQGALAAGMPALTGEPGSEGDMTTGAMVGGLVGGGRMLHQRFGTAPQERLREVRKAQAGRNLYSALREGVPKTGELSEQAQESLQHWFPIMHEFSAGKKINNLKDLRVANENMTNSFWDRVIAPMTNPIKGEAVDTSEIANRVIKRLGENKLWKTETRFQPVIEKLGKNIKADYEGKTMTVGELMELRSALNKRTTMIQKKLAINPKLIESNPGYAADMEKLSALRDLINETITKYNKGMKLPEVEAAMKTMKHLTDMGDYIKSADQANTVRKNLEAGMRHPKGAFVGGTFGEGSFGPSVRAYVSPGQLMRMAGAKRNQPDALVKHAFKLLSWVTPDYQIPITGRIRPPELPALPEKPDFMQ